MIDDNEITLETIKHLSNTEPAYRNFFLRAKVHAGQGDYNRFIEALYIDLAFAFQKLSSSAFLRNEDLEDRVTQDIIDMLMAQGWRASHDKSQNGHVDLTVESTIYTWIGEAKRDKGYSKVIGGFDQLFSRYSNPYDYHVKAHTGESQNKAGILIYIQEHSDCADYMNNFLKKLEEHCQKKYTPLKHRKIDDLIMETQHKHEKSGTDIIVRHMPLMLMFDPKDRK